ncbi:GNAT family N-acetyltransferase [Rossellomorea marisflavi]|uniref:GNAT family N-acetyltransferase n=1 Tax=Rossellomorea marisflavi TaxID=189381 RepID=UPI003FA116EC
MVIAEPKKVTYQSVADCPHRYDLFVNEKKIGHMVLKRLRELKANILEDLLEDEEEQMYIKFYELSFSDALYLDGFSIDEEYQGQGYGKQIIGDLLARRKCPVLLYSLRESEEFWEKMNFENIAGYYYVWQP